MAISTDVLMAILVFFTVDNTRLKLNAPLSKQPLLA